MRKRMRLRSGRIISVIALALAVTVMLAGCPKKEEVSGPPPSAPPEAQAPPAPPGSAPPAPAPPAPPTSVAPPTKAPPPSAARPGTPSPASPPQPAARPVLPEGTTYFVHTVKYQGETISIIAAWYLGDKMRFDVLAAANPEINPTLIKVGMNIKIPENVAKTREPITKEFVDSFYKRPPTEKSPPAGPAKGEEPAPKGPK